jgi:hypothetical protein
MGTRGKTGIGPRHRFDLLTRSERHERQLAEARREIDKLRHHSEALESTLRTICKLGSHYVTNGHKLR